MNFSEREAHLLTHCNNSSGCQNSYCSLLGSRKTELFSTQDGDLVSVLVDLENIEKKIDANASGKKQAFGYFSLSILSNLSQQISMDNKVKLPVKVFDYASIQSTLNDSKLGKNLEEFKQSMGLFLQ